MSSPGPQPRAGDDSPTRRPRVSKGLIVRRQGQVLLGLRCGSHGAGTWALPGGHPEYGKTPEACAARELLEETGLRAIDLLRGPWTNDFIPADGGHYLTVFMLCRGEVGEPRVLEPHKCERWAWCDWARLRQPLFAPLAALLQSGYKPGPD